MTDILADPLARARTFGTDSVLAIRLWTAVKTGTSKDMSDSWELGYSQRYTVGVWVGNASGAPMWDVSGTTGASPIWAAVMNHLHRTEQSRAPTAPTGLVQGRVTFDGIEAARKNGLLKVRSKINLLFIQELIKPVFYRSKTKKSPERALLKLR